MSTAARSGRIFAARAFAGAGLLWLACAAGAQSRPTSQPVAPPKPSAADPNTVVYWAGKGYGVYHAAGCQQIAGRKPTASAIALSVARDLDLEPCNRCHPPLTQDLPKTPPRKIDEFERLERRAANCSAEQASELLAEFGQLAERLPALSSSDALHARQAMSAVAARMHTLCIQQQNIAVETTKIDEDFPLIGYVSGVLNAKVDPSGKVVAFFGDVMGVSGGVASVRVEAHVSYDRHVKTYTLGRARVTVPDGLRWSDGVRVFVIGRVARLGKDQLKDGAPLQIDPLPGTE